ncbi:MAG: IclR family transcriptional regulator [Acidimicrobiia bacterium]|nr:IclR family transcriptional regulator [Acidimicrobiia bacterium]
MNDHVQSVIRAFDILRVLAARTEVSLGDLAAETGLPKSTASRILNTLMSIGMVNRGSTDGTYTPGPALASVSPQGTSAEVLAGVAKPYLSELTAALDEDSAMALPAGDALIYTLQIQSQNPVQVPDSTGHRFAPHVVAAGQVWMAHWPERELEDYLSRPLTPVTPKTIVDPARIRELCSTIKTAGYGWAFDGWVEGVSAVAAPVFDSDHELAALLSVFGPSYRFPGERDTAEVGEMVARAAQMMSRHL